MIQFKDPNLISQLNLAGYRLNQDEEFKARKLYFDLNTIVVSFNFQLTGESIKSAWLSYLSSLPSFNFVSSEVKVSIIDQNLYYDNEYALNLITFICGIKLNLVFKNIANQLLE